MKKMLSLILAVCMLTLLFGACAKPAEEPAAPAATEAPAAPAATEAPAAPAATEAPAEPAAPAEDTVLAFMVKNKAKGADDSSLELTELYLYPKGSEEKFDNIMNGIPQINSSEYQDYLRVVCIRPAAEAYEAYAVFSNGEEGIYKNLEMMNKNSLSFKAADEVSCKADEDVAFTEEIKTEALADGSKTKALATLAFELKNKTDVAISAIYIYPVGAADKGSNILEGEFKSSGEHEDYLHPVILRERAAEYEVYVEFADGTAPMTITGLAMDNAITLSLKDTVGVEFSCDVIGTEDVEEDDLQEYYAIFTEDFVKPLQNEAKTCH